MCIFLDGHRLAGERGFVSGQAVTLQQACVGRDTLSCLKKDEIAGNNILHVDLHILPMATNNGSRFVEGTESGDGFFGPVFVEHLRTNQQQNHAEDDEGVFEISPHRVQDSCPQQEQDQRFANLFQEDLPDRLLPGCGESIRSELGQSLKDGCLVQASAAVRAEMALNLGGCHGIPCAVRHAQCYRRALPL